EMQPADGSLTAPGRGPGRSPLDRIRRTYSEAPLALKIVIVAVCCIVGFPVAVVMAPYAIFSGSRSIWATASIVIVGFLIVASQAHGDLIPRSTLYLLPIMAAVIAHLGALGRWYAPCRTVGWVLLVALLPGVELFQHLHSGTSYIGPGF